ncbi:hypothetical protein [Butyrivibrio sp. AE3004]|uniref:hypothetical protein n=1 Tax=Butyrivibrio sp. AE3004 TaxID=1506994 RepID=UPI0004945ACA|nr:hypothetical protein [Butyrivibrio sp. AE3004]
MLFTKHEISEYKTRGKASDIRGRVFIYKCDFYNGKRKEHSTFENDFDRIYHGKIFTFNPSYEDALRIFDEYFFEKKEAARKEAEKLAAQYERFRQNLN